MYFCYCICVSYLLSPSASSFLTGVFESCLLEVRIVWEEVIKIIIAWLCTKHWLTFLTNLMALRTWFCHFAYLKWCFLSFNLQHPFKILPWICRGLGFIICYTKYFLGCSQFWDGEHTWFLWFQRLKSRCNKCSMRFCNNAFAYLFLQ